MPAQPPYILAMVVCDEVHLDPGTGKRTILGTFSTLYARDFPAVVQRLKVYVAVTDGRDLTSLELLVSDLDGEPIPGLEDRVELDFDDPRTVYEVELFLEGITFPVPGEVRFHLLSDGESVMERSLKMVAIEEVDRG